MNYIGGSPKADHLCVLVHGLGGNPNSMKNVAKSLRDRYSPEQIYLLLAKSNRGSLSYDGIERGGERLCAEVEKELSAIENNGGKIKKLSFIGHSLGGLVSRYAIGLLHVRGHFDSIKCMNFATFATPHLGVRSPTKGWFNHLWNILGARTFSASGRQLFTIDLFRDTGRPLLAVLADHKYVFVLGLQKFERRSLYTNVANDESTAYYTTGIQKSDPYIDLNNLKVNYVKGFEEVILDPKHPFTLRPKMKDPVSVLLTKSAMEGLKKVPYLLSWPIFLSIGIIAFLVNSAVQTIRSSYRIKLYENGKAGFGIEQYRKQVWAKNNHEEKIHGSKASDNAQKQEYTAVLSGHTETTLALASHQFEMIDSLNSLGWRKYPVWIQKVSHGHTAIIASMETLSLSEGHVVLGHFVDKEFII